MTFDINWFTSGRIKDSMDMKSHPTRMAFVRWAGEKHSWTRKNRSGAISWRESLQDSQKSLRDSNLETCVFSASRKSQLFLLGQAGVLCGFQRTGIPAVFAGTKTSRMSG